MDKIPDFETSPPHVLVVDDEPVFVELVRLWLERANYQVTCAFTGEEALQMLGHTPEPALYVPPFDLVLLDIMMPGLNGKEVCQRIRAHPPTAQLPVLILSALSSSVERVEALQAGANDYLTKPFIGVELLTRVGNLIRWYRMERASQAKIRLRNRELQALNEIGATLNQTLRLPDLLHETLDVVCQVAGLAWGAIYLLDPVAQQLDIAAYRDVPLTFVLDGGFGPRDDSVMWQMIEDMQPLVSPAISLQPEPNWDDQQDAVVYHCVLLAAKGQPVGLMVVGGEGQAELPPEKVQLLGAIGNQIGVAVANARLYAHEQQQVLELKSLTQELERSQAQLVQSAKMAAVGRLAAALAHEINNPLQAIHNCLTLSQRVSPGPGEQVDYMRLAEKEVERLIGLVQRMLDFYRPSHSHHTLTDVNGLVKGVVEMARKKLSESHIDLHLDLAPQLPPVHVISDQISQVILNLMLNAAEILTDGGRLELSSRRVEGENGAPPTWVEVSVRDDGPGLSPDQVQHIFEPFSAHPAQSNGSGLGLAISFGIVERHGGTIQVDSAPDAGTTFRLRLPVEKDNGR